MKKTGDANTVWVIISAIIAIIVLIVIWLIFSGNLGNMIDSLKNFITGILAELKGTDVKDIVKP